MSRPPEAREDDGLGAGLPRLIRSADCAVMPWKNGGGSTAEIAAFPRGAGLDAFHWRVSMAKVERDGPFSPFPGIDRTLAIIAGRGLRLGVGEAPPVDLTGEDPPLAFAADVPTHASLLAGPVTDLNVMTRRGVFWHRSRWVAPAAGERLSTAAPLVFLVCAGPRAELRVNGALVILSARDTLVARGGEERPGSGDIVAASSCRLCQVEIGTV